MKPFLRSLNSQQRGQAMTEMLVASAFVVIPLFLIIPTVGKYIDMKHAAIDAARYTAWERTVYFNAATFDNQPSGFDGFNTNGGLFPMKEDDKLLHEAQLRIFNDAQAPIESLTQAGRKFWTHYNGSPMYGPLMTDTPISVTSNEDTPDVTLGVARDSLHYFASRVSWAMDMIPFNSSRFDAINIRGGTTAEVAMRVTEMPRYLTTLGDNSGQRTPLIDVGSNFKMLAKASVLSQTWSAGGGAHLQSQAQAFAPTKLIGDFFNLIDVPGIGSGQNLIATALLTPEFSDDNLVFGHMDVDVLPRDKFSNPVFPAADDADEPLCNDKGYCRE